MIKPHTLLISIFTLTLSAKVQVDLQLLDSPVHDMAWCGTKVVFTRDDETVEQEHTDGHTKALFVLTDDGVIWRSDNYGKTWANQNLVLEEENLVFEDLQISAANSRVIFLFGSDGVSYRTDNCGIT